MCIYILRPASILKLNSKSHFIQTHGRITFPQSRNPLSSQKVRKNHFQSIKKHNAKKYIYMATIFIQKKREKKNTKEHDPSTIEATFRQQEEKENTLMEDRQGESPVISLDSSETQSRMEIQPTPWAADSPSPTRSARACLTRDSARVSALDRSHPILHAGKRSIIRRSDDCFLEIRRFPCVSEDLTCVRAGWLSFRSIFRGKQVAGCVINLCFSLDLCRNKS